MNDINHMTYTLILHFIRYCINEDQIFSESRISTYQRYEFDFDYSLIEHKTMNRTPIAKI